jgi:hypothetical protein
MDSGGKGGPRRALYDFGLNRPDARITYFEQPLWPDPCGAATVCKQALHPRPDLDQTPR